MIAPARFADITSRYRGLSVAVVGDFCLDRYLEIDPEVQEISIETGLPVHNVVRVRAQPGGAGTILNNLAALGVGAIHPIGFCGDDGEGYELCRALEKLPGVRCASFLRTPLRRTFTYCKPLLLTADEPPVELNRLDSKNWTATPGEVQDALIQHLSNLANELHAVILLDQVDVAETGVVTKRMLEAVRQLAARRADLWILADSRRGLRGFPQVCLKMNRAELTAMLGGHLHDIKAAAAELARRHGRPIFVTLAEQGMVGATPEGVVERIAALPVRGPIDIVGAGDCVTANLIAALAAGGTLQEALQIATAAASIVIHQLGTTGTATPEQIRPLVTLTPGPSPGVPREGRQT